MTVTDGKRVSIAYTVTLEDQTPVYSNVDGEPLTYIQGGQDVLPALQKGLIGLAVGETKRVTLSPDEAYGAVDPNAFQEVHKVRVPEKARTIGKRLVAKDAAGRTQHARIHDIKTNTVVLDLNHPLAGKTLTIEVKVLSVEEAAAE